MWEIFAKTEGHCLDLTKDTIFDSRGGVEGQEFLKKT